MWLFEVLGALDYCRSAVVVYGAWPECVLRGCENACGCPGLFLALDYCGLLSFWDFVKTYVAVLGSLGPCTEVGLLGALGMAQMHFGRL